MEQVLWVQATDIDRMTALMCYIQLTLWNIPAEVIVGNTLTMEYREHWFTFAHHRYGWRERLRASADDSDDLQVCKKIQSPVHYHAPDGDQNHSPLDHSSADKSTASSSRFDHTMRQDSFDF